MEWSFMIPALLIGLGGSLHCVGMCGPLLFSSIMQPVDDVFPLIKWTLYQTGRILIYACWGVLFGSFGYSLKWMGWQQNISLALGISMLVILLVQQFFPASESIFSSVKTIGKITRLLKPHLLSGKFFSPFLSGMLNGILPCGLVYMAIAGAAVMQDPFKGALFMIAFGLGTTPLLLAVLMAGRKLQSGIRKYFTVSYTYILVFMAILLIIRGLNLGVLFSPSAGPDKSGILHCTTE